MSPPHDVLLPKNQQQLEQFIEAADIETLVSLIQGLVKQGDRHALATLRRLLSTRGVSVYDKPIPSQLAARGMLAFGPDGVAELKDALLTSRVRYAPRVLQALVRLAKGDSSPAPTPRDVPFDLLDLSFPDTTYDAARRTVADVFSEVTSNPRALFLVVNLLQQISIPTFSKGDGENLGDSSSDVVEVMHLLTDATIRLTPAVLDAFNILIGRRALEEDYQRFIAKHPVFLDPLAAKIIAKQRLGTEYATDYVIQRHDGRWILVEIERPQDGIFTAKSDFSARFTHAFGQVLDFQRWIDANIAYAQNAMPGIINPRGLVVIGTRSSLTPDQESKLHSFVNNSTRVAVATYDDLLTSAEHLYRSLHYT